MAKVSEQTFKKFNDPCLPYDTNSSVVSEGDSFVAGSNLMLSIKKQLERRPGFSTSVETGGVSKFNSVKNIYTWRRWGGSFFIMLCDVTASTSKVYKLEIGVDSVFQLCYTATATDGKTFFFIESNNTCFMGNGNVNDMRKYDGRSSPYSDNQLTSMWGIDAPIAAPTWTLTAGSVNGSAGYNHVYTYSNSSTGHQSGASPVSVCTGTFSSKQVNVNVVASPDAQVDGIRVYRTTDNGGTALELFREITGSPFPNATTFVVDNTADVDLGDEFAPADTINDPPPGLSGFVSHAGRIWGLRNNEAWYSAFEEAPSGVPEECWPGAVAHNADGNFYPYSSEVNALATTPDGVGIFSALQINAVMGDSLDTFLRMKLADLQGARQALAVKSFGGSVMWLDTMDSPWMLGGNEIGEPIRPDFENIDHSKTSLVLHLQGKRRWLILLDGAGQRLFVFDLDLEKWNVPWNIAGITAIWSGETSSGHIDLMAAINGSIYKLDTTKFNDAGSPYSCTGTLGLTDLSPDSHPDWRAVVDSVSIERNNAGDLSKVEVCLDDDPTTGTFVDLTPNIQPQPLRSRTATNLIAKQYPTGSTGSPTAWVGRRISVRLTWPTVDRADILYSFHVGYHGA